MKKHFLRLRKWAASRIENRKIIDYTGCFKSNPITCYYAAKGNPFLAELPLKRCRHLKYLGFECTPESKSPFVQTLREYAEGHHTRYTGSVLQNYYESFKPQNVAEIMGLNPEECSPVLINNPAMSEIAVWNSGNHQAELKRRKRQIEQDNLLHGYHYKSDDGDPFYGPVSERKGTLEFTRLIKTYNSIKEKGYSVSDVNSIKGIILKAGGEWRCQILVGQHRIAALAALGYENVPILIGNQGIIHREDVEMWPLVQENIITTKQALTVFDRIFEGHPPEMALKHLG